MANDSTWIKENILNLKLRRLTAPEGFPLDPQIEKIMDFINEEIVVGIERWIINNAKQKELVSKAEIISAWKRLEGQQVPHGVAPLLKELGSE